MIPATKTEHKSTPSRAPRRPPARHQPTEQGGMGAFYAGGGGAVLHFGLETAHKNSHSTWFNCA